MNELFCSDNRNGISVKFHSVDVLDSFFLLPSFTFIFVFEVWRLSFPTGTFLAVVEFFEVENLVERNSVKVLVQRRVIRAVRTAGTGGACKVSVICETAACRLPNCPLKIVEKNVSGEVVSAIFVS